MRLNLAAVDNQIVLEETFFLEDVQVIELNEKLLLFVKCGVEEDMEPVAILVLVFLHIISD